MSKLRRSEQLLSKEEPDPPSYENIVNFIASFLVNQFPTLIKRQETYNNLYAETSLEQFDAALKETEVPSQEQGIKEKSIFVQSDSNDLSEFQLYFQEVMEKIALINKKIAGLQAERNIWDTEDTKAIKALETKIKHQCDKLCKSPRSIVKNVGPEINEISNTESQLD